MGAINRDSFVFYNSFFEAIDECPIDCQRNIYRAIALYALRGEEPQLSGVEKAVFIMAKPQIDANTKRYLNGTKGKEYGKKGGAPKGNKNAAKNKNAEPESEPEPDSEPEPEEKMSGHDFYINAVSNFNKLKAFAVSHGYTEHDAENFLEYNFCNRPMGCKSNDIFDKSGNVIGNVYGAFLNFASSGYDRETWLKEHGMKKGQNNP